MMDALHHTATTSTIYRWRVASTVISMLRLMLISSSDAFINVQHQHPSSSLCIMSSSSSTHQSTNHATLIQGFDRQTAQQVVTNTLCPPNEERSRNNAGMEAFGEDRNSKVITNDDPRNEYTYGEFPFDSFDLLVDRAIEYVDTDQQQHGEDSTNRNMLDLGSGCGRLVLYAGLTNRSGWDITGIEIGKQLHSLAVNSLQRGINEDLLKPAIAHDASTANSNSKISFYNGNALGGEDPYFQDTASDDETIQSILSEASLLFAYSTVWETDSSQPFNPELQAMVLSSKWSKSLAAVCQNGVVAVTTDRVLNPEDGWKLLDRMDVDNPSVWGSVGYISVLQK